MNGNDLTSFLPATLAVLVLGLVWAHQRKKSRNSQPVQTPLDEGAAPEYRGAFAFIRRHYNGDYSLARSYWVHTVLVSVAVSTLATVLVPWLGKQLSARYASAAFLFITAFALLAWVWGVKGTWGSAEKHVQRGGRSGWAIAAHLTILFGVFKTVTAVVGMAPMLKEHVRVAAGAQLGPETHFEVRADGRSILLSGGINDGSAERLEQALDSAPSVKVVALSSQGGWIREGGMLAEVIRKRGLNTYVEGYCSSACTIAFLAGKERAAAPMAKIGFHASRHVGGTRSDASPEESDWLRSIYRDAGLPDSFIRQALDTPNDKMWYPSQETLLSAGVLTRRSMGGETAVMATSIQSREALAAELRTSELFAALSERAPTQFEAIVNTVWPKMQQGATDAEVFLAARARLTEVLPRFLPLASDDTLIQYQELMQEELEALRARDVTACVDAVFPSDQSAANVISKTPPELMKREAVLMTKVLRESDPSRAVAPNAQALGRVGLRASARMTREELAAFSNEETRRRSPPDVVCNATIKFFAGVNAIPLAERAAALRVIYSVQ